MASDASANLSSLTPSLGEIAPLLLPSNPLSGRWSDDDFLQFEAEHRHVELVQGYIEVKPIPTKYHQRIIRFLCKLLEAWNEAAKRGEVFDDTLPLLLFAGTIREPDVLLVPDTPEEAESDYAKSAIVVMEVVSEGNDARKRDYKGKREDYSKAGIPEYWIVDPQERSVTVLELKSSEYVEHGRFEGDQIATSATLEGFSVACGDIWALERKSEKKSKSGPDT